MEDAAVAAEERKEDCCYPIIWQLHKPLFRLFLSVGTWLDSLELRKTRFYLFKLLIMDFEAKITNLINDRKIRSKEIANLFAGHSYHSTPPNKGVKSLDMRYSGKRNDDHSNKRMLKHRVAQPVLEVGKKKTRKHKLNLSILPTSTNSVHRPGGDLQADKMISAATENIETSVIEELAVDTGLDTTSLSANALDLDVEFSHAGEEGGGGMNHSSLLLQASSPVQPRVLANDKIHNISGEAVVGVEGHKGENKGISTASISSSLQSRFNISVDNSNSSSFSHKKGTKLSVEERKISPRSMGEGSINMLNAASMTSSSLYSGSVVKNGYSIAAARSSIIEPSEPGTAALRSNDLLTESWLNNLLQNSVNKVEYVDTDVGRSRRNALVSKIAVTKLKEPEDGSSTYAISSDLRTFAHQMKSSELGKLGLNRLDLVERGLTSEMVDRIYRGIYVYTSKFSRFILL